MLEYHFFLIMYLKNIFRLHGGVIWSPFIALSNIIQRHSKLCLAGQPAITSYDVWMYRRTMVFVNSSDVWKTLGKHILSRVLLLGFRTLKKF